VTVVARGALALLALALVTGCSSSGSEEPTPSARAENPRPARDRLQPARCPAELSNCRSASGRIIYVERVDPDGDGDAHFVLISREAITGPGVSVIDVKKSLRPSPLPGPGDRLSAAGPVYRGSYKQKQIEAIELHVAYAAGRGRAEGKDAAG
jgi:hypothetical protein